jgi:hypothetical protein
MRFARVSAICLLSLTTMVATAASADAQALSYGAKGGLDLTHLHFGSSFAPDTGTSPGVVGGGFVAWRLADRFDLRGEGLVVQERAIFESVITDTIRTIDVPVLVRFRAASPGGRAVHVSAGIVLRRVFDASESAAGESASITNGVTRSNQALAVGGSIAILSHWTADVRYLQGGTGLYKKIGGGSEGKARTVQVTGEYRF